MRVLRVQLVASGEMEIVMKTRGKMEICLKAVAEDEARKEFQAVIRFCDIDGNDRLLSVPRSRRGLAGNSRPR
jgi:hypothetical protein